MQRAWKRRWQRTMAKLILPPVMAAGIFFSVYSVGLASPSGATVTTGTAVIATSGSKMTITTSDKAAINWQSYNIAKGETVQYIQPSSSSVALNRVTGSNASKIYGTLSANGKVFLINPNGVLFAPGSSVNVGGLVASTLTLSDSDFLKNNYKFSGDSSAAVINQGSITTADGGYVALLGAQAKNEGVIVANQGTVALGAGKAVTLDLAGDGFLNLVVDQSALSASVANSGVIQADGGKVYMSARTADALAGTVINNSGTIQARSISSKNGVIVLDGGDNGVVQVTGTLDASGQTSGTSGGRITVTGNKVGLLDNALVDVSGMNGGGQVYIGGGWQGKDSAIRNASAVVMSKDAAIKADATNTGKGGTVALWSQNYTGFYGSISAKGGVAGGDGGQVETSSHNNLQAWGHVTASAPKGKAGIYLLDPYDVSITDDATSGDMGGSYGPPDDVYEPQSTASIINAAEISLSLETNNVVITTGGIGPDAGNIKVLADITKTAGSETTLTLQAGRSIFIGGDADGTFRYNTTIQSTNNKLNVVLNPGRNVDGIGGVKLYHNTKIITNGGDVTVGGGNNPVTGYAIGKDIANAGLYLEGLESGGSVAAIINAGGGNILVHGKPRSGGGVGIWIGRGSSLTTTSTGNVSLYGFNDLSVPGDGVDIQGTVHTDQGTVLIDGRTNWGSSGGVYIDGTGKVEGQTVNITGEVGGNSTWSGGINLQGAIITAGSGGVSMNGSAPGGTSNSGVYIGSGQITSSGNITITGIGSNEASGVDGYNSGVVIGDPLSGTATIQTSNGNIVINGTGGTSAGSDNQGVVIGSGSIVKNTGSGSVTITAVAGGNSSGAEFNGRLEAAGGTITVQTTAGDVVLNTGAQIVSSASGNAIIIAPAEGHNFKNNVGGSALSAANGRWIIYSDNVVNTTLNGLTADNMTNGTYATLAPTSGSMPSGNVVVYKVGKMIIIVIDDKVIYYGDAKPVFTYTMKKSDTGQTVTGAFTAVPVLDATGYTVGNGVNNYTITANTSGVVLSSALIGDGYSLGTVTNGTLRVDPKVLIVTGMTADNKEYNGNATATVHAGGATLTGTIGADVVSLVTGAATGSFADKNVGTGKVVTVSGLSLTGAAATNYTLGTVNSPTANISAKALNVTNITADNKQYNGNADATVHAGGAVLAPSIGGDVVSLVTGGVTGSFADKNVGIGKAVTVSGLSLTGSDAGNYTVGTVNSPTANITAKALTVIGITADNKEYDGNDIATVHAVSPTLSGKIGSDVVTLVTGGVTGSFADKNVGTGKAVTVSGLSMTGGDAGNYTLGAVNSPTANITAKALTVIGITADNKEYDRNDTATVHAVSPTLSGKIGSDVVTLVTGGVTGSFADKNVGTGKAVTVSGLSLTGSDAGNYTVGTVNSPTANITAKVLTVTGVTAANKEYDGTASATVHSGSAALAGKIGSDVVSLVTGGVTGGVTGSFADKNVGTGKAVTVSGLSLTGSDAGNYTVGTVNSPTANITAKALNVTGITADNKEYNGNATATVHAGSAALVGAIGSDVVTLVTGGAIGSFADKNVGTGKAVTVSGLSMTGGDAGNYTLGAVNSPTANISAKALNVTGITADNKQYNGNADATVHAGGAVLATTIGGDVVSLVTGAATGSFADKNVGTGKVVTVSGLSLTGAAATNYTLGTVNSPTANIIAKDITVQLTGTVSKQYDGNTVATLQNVNYQLNGKVAGDMVVANGTGSYDTADIGDNKTVSVTGIVLGGTDGANYSLPINTASGPIGKITSVPTPDPTPTLTTPPSPYTAAIASAVTGTGLAQGTSTGSGTVTTPVIPTATTAISSGSVAGLQVIGSGVNVAPAPSTPATTPASNTMSSITATGNNVLQLQTGMNTASMTVTEVGSTLTITVPGMVQQAASQQNVAVFTSGATGSSVAGAYIVQSSQGTIAVTPTGTTVSSVPANPTGNAQAVTGVFTMLGFNGGLAQFTFTYADGALSIQPVNPAAFSLMSGAGQKLITGTGLLAAQTELGTVNQVQAVYLEQAEQ